MTFLALIAGITVLAWIIDRAGVPGLGDWPARMRLGMAAGFAMAGVDHLVTPARYIAMVEGWLPWPAEAVAVTGLCEIAGAVGLMAPRLRRAAGVVLAVYLVCVFPANVANAVRGLAVEGLPASETYYWVRLAFQPLFVWWALFAAEVLRWPFARRMAAA